MDDFSRCNWVHALKLKSNARSTSLQGFCSMIETQLETKIKVIILDNGGEFDMKRFYMQKEIIHQRTYAETPQQNAIVERKHGHILNVARALKFQSGMPSKYWSDCVLIVVYLINRTPTLLLDHKTPFEMLFWSKLIYSHLKVFRYLAFTTTLVNEGHKFDSMARKFIFLGILLESRGTN